MSQRVASISPSPTLAVDARAKALKAAGEKVIGFGAGEPDLPTPEHIVRAVAEAASHALYHHYTATGGLPELRAATRAIPSATPASRSRHRKSSSPTEASTHCSTPSAEGVFTEIPTTEETGFKVTIEQLEAALTPRTVLLFVSPSNPTVGQDAAFEKGIELLFDELGQTCPGLKLDLGHEGLEVFLNQLIDDGVFGTPTFVVYVPCRWRGLNRFAHCP